MFSIFKYPLLYFFAGHLIMIGIGSYWRNDIYSLKLILLGQFSFVLGWFFPKIIFFILSTPSSKEEEMIPVNLYWGLGSFLLIIIGYIHLRYGLPIFKEDSGVARLEVRNYIFLVFCLEYGLTILMALSIFVDKKNPNLYILIAILISAAISSSLATRYMFIQSFLVVVVLFLTLNRLSSIKKFILLCFAMMLTIVFYGLVQLLRSGEMEFSKLFEKLINRFIYINHEIFSVIIYGNMDIPHATYLNPLFKIIGEETFNSGFFLYNRMPSTSAEVQGYAPPSLIGEAYMNFPDPFYASIALITIGFILSLYIAVLNYSLKGVYKTIFQAYVCVELFRLYAHTLVGAAVGITSIYLLLLCVLGASKLQESRQ